jgi:hypothetical protein
MVRLERLGKLKKSNALIVNRTRDLRPRGVSNFRHRIEKKTFVPWLKAYVAGILQLAPGFDHRSGHVDNAVFFEYSSFSWQFPFHQPLYIH